jgi:hypothetical protein
MEAFLAGTDEMQIELEPETAGIPWELLDTEPTSTIPTGGRGRSAPSCSASCAPQFAPTSPTRTELERAGDRRARVSGELPAPLRRA